MDNALGEFLRARRELVTPAEVGLPAGNGLRRVRGLRREEVATLAGISVEYYLRLEQGRDRSPSAQVIDAIAEVLRLDAEGAAYLTALAAPKPRRRPTRREPSVSPGLAMLLATINVPAIVFDKYGDVLAANPLARELAPDLAPGVNRLRMLFTDPGAPGYHPDWEDYTAAVVAHLRAQIGADLEDERLQALVDELSLTSDRFRELWARHDVRAARPGPFVLHHPRVGDLELLVEKFAVTGADLEALLLHAEPGNRSADALAELEAVVATEFSA